ncbi:hypothetical protein [Bremerella alba]|uniref:Uncharacterized protein n=1 Tax=Bremerella alba TaxID=980252 RepID=A0A7V8V9D0_9BACT|nr:hypothetical protein [Bremerella alba]MBA2117359.1 hypothetical protein [Bremerella alba]
MRIETQPSSTLTRQQQQDAAGEQLQNLFNEILTAAKQPGYASAEKYQSDNSIPEDIQQDWNDWFSVANTGNYPSKVDAQALPGDYGTLLVRTYTEGGYADPQGFLQNLTEDELATVQHVHRLAEPIDVDSLTPEAALNLLIPRPAQVDLNYDGLTQVGQGYTIRFPDSRTPEAVVNAWNETTTDMDPMEKSFYELQMKLPTLLANFEIDDQGRYVGHTEPGDPNWVNPQADSNYSYTDLTEQMLDYLDYFQHQIPQDQYEQQRSFYSTFQQSLQEHGAR